MSPPKSSRLPFELVHECLSYLPYRDLLTCQRVSKDFWRLIRDSTEFQLCIHLGENGIHDSRPLWKQTVPTSFSELRRLQGISTRFNNLHFGQAYRDISTVQLSATTVENLNMISVDSQHVFVSWTMPGRTETSGIGRYQVNYLQAPPSLMSFVRKIRHFEVDAAESVLLVV